MSVIGERQVGSAKSRKFYPIGRRWYISINNAYLFMSFNHDLLCYKKKIQVTIE
jgi:hypothetical protein